MQKKYLKKIMAKKFPTFDQKYKHTHRGSPKNPKHKKHKENYTKIKFLKTGDNEKILKAARKKATLQRNKDNDGRFLTRISISEKAVRQHL